MKLCMTELDIFEKLFLPQKLGKWVKNKVFFNNFQIICSIMNLYIIVWVPKQIPYLGNFFFSRLGQNALRQSDCRIFKLTISPEQIDETASFFAC